MGNLKLMNGRTRHTILPVSYFPLKLLPFPSPWKTVGENAAGREFPRGIAARKKWLSTCLLPLLQSISKNILQWRKDHYAHMRLQRNIQDLDHINPSSETKSETPQLLWFTGIQPHFHLWTLLFFKRSYIITTCTICVSLVKRTLSVLFSLLISIRDTRDKNHTTYLYSHLTLFT